MHRTRKGRLLLVLAVALVAATAVAVAKSQSGSAAPQTTHKLIGGLVTQLQVLTNDSAATIGSTSYVTIPGGVTFVPVPPSSRALIKAQFDAESACYGDGSAGHWCSIRILIGGIEGSPQSGLDFAFDSTNAGRETATSWESHSMTRARCFVDTSGSTVNVPVVVQAAVPGSGVFFRLDDWELDTYRTNVCSQSF